MEKNLQAKNRQKKIAVWSERIAACRSGGMSAAWRRCRDGCKGVCFSRSGCKTTNGQCVVLARRTHTYLSPPGPYVPANL